VFRHRPRFSGASATSLIDGTRIVVLLLPLVMRE